LLSTARELRPQERRLPGLCPCPLILLPGLRPCPLILLPAARGQKVLRGIGDDVFDEPVQSAARGVDRCAGGVDRCAGVHAMGVSEAGSLALA